MKKLLMKQLINELLWLKTKPIAATFQQVSQAFWQL